MFTGTPTAGDDMFNGAAITDTDIIDGGAGTDTLFLSTDYTLAGNITNIEIITVVPDTGINVRWQHSNLTGNVPGITMNSNAVGNDTLGGTNANDTIMGNGGNDSLQGFNGNDSIDGGAGNDTIKAGKGDDTVLGGDGNDVLIGGRGDDNMSGGAGDDTIDLVTFGQANTAIGPQGGGKNMLSGDAGNDIIWGSVGNDTLLGGDGNDLLLGNAGNDSIDSGAGTDSVFGGQGDDSIQVNSDAATLYYNTSALSPDGTDTIVGFATGVDKIALVAFDSTASQTFSATALDAQILTGAALQTAITDAVASQQTNGMGILSLSNGTKMIFSGVTANLTASDFVGAAETFTLTSSSPSVVEGNSGTTDMTFDLTLSAAPVLAPVTVSYQTLTTGNATEGTDFTAATGTATFAIGQTTASVTVAIIGDTDFEPDETVQVGFSGTQLASVIGSGTITNDDTATVAISATTTPASSDAASSDLLFTVAAGTYTYTIAGFGAGDKIDFPATQEPTVNNSSFSDNSVDLQWADSGNVVTITLTGLAAGQDMMLNSVADFNTVLGAGTIF